jgi:hypothetical protein
MQLGETELESRIGVWSRMRLLFATERKDWHQDPRDAFSLSNDGALVDEAPHSGQLLT